MKPILTDSSFIYSLFDGYDPNHERSLTLFDSRTDWRVVMPEVVMAEVTFLFNRRGGVSSVSRFLRDFVDSGITPILTTTPDYERAAAIMDTYADARLDFVDCVLMALSERLGLTEVCTFDRRDFAMFRPRHCDFLTLLP